MPDRGEPDRLYMLEWEETLVFIIITLLRNVH
jgi:hypothetical protein